MKSTFMIKTVLFQMTGLRKLVGLVKLTICCLFFTIPVQAADFPVTNTYDSGPGSLRQAITNANSAPAGPHRIVFNVYGEIVLSSSLPDIISNGLVVDGQNKITLTTTGGDVGVIFFTINANQVVVRNMSFLNTGYNFIVIKPNTTDVTIRHITANHNGGNYIDNIVLVNGASTNLTISDVTSTRGLQACGTSATYGRPFYFTGGTQTNLVMDSIYVSTTATATGCEAIVFRDAGVNGLKITNTRIHGFYSAIVLDNYTGAAETATDVLLNKVTVDSLLVGSSYGFYSDFINSNITIKNSVFDLDVPGSTDDGNYGIFFDNTTAGVMIDSVTATGMDDYGARFTGAASTVSITNSSFTCGAAGQYSTTMIRFDNTATGVTISKVGFDGDISAVTDDADYGIVFNGATTDITLDKLTFNEFDLDAISVNAANTNFQLTSSIFTNNYDGIEFYNQVARTNVDVTNCLFKGTKGNRCGILIGAANAVFDVDCTGDTVINYPSHAIWLYGGSPVSDVTISGCVIHDNGGAGIYNENPDKAIYTGNFIYNNTGGGIDNTATGNCGYQGTAYTPALVTSTSLGGGQYQVQLNMPAICAAGCTVELYANDPAVTAASGQYPVATFTNVLNGVSTQTVTYNTGPGATGLGFWTATLQVPSNNCGTSEFSNKLAMGMKGPACINDGILGWYRADMGANGVNWADISGNANHLLASGDPDDTTGLVNFNKAIYYDGNDYHYVPSGAAVTTAYTIMGLGRLEGTQNARVFGSTTGNKLMGFFSGQENAYYNEAWLKNSTPLTNYTKLYSVKRANSGSGPWEFKGNGVLLGSGASSTNTVWTLGVGGVYVGTTIVELSKVFVPEVFIYNRDLTIPEIQRLESYMALKYGITLNNGNTDYIASDGTTLMWGVSANTGFGKRITGIGRDDCTLLHQKQSISQDTGMVTIALGNSIFVSNAANASQVTNDKTFLVFSDNNDAATFTTAVSSTNATQRMARVWKVQKSAGWADQPITLEVKGANSNNYLLISSVSSFATISQELPFDGSGRVTLNSALLNNNGYFTIGASIKGPNNVNTGVVLWLRADDGSANNATWNDFSGNGISAYQTTAANLPLKRDTGLNYNGAFFFDGTDDYMTVPVAGRAGFPFGATARTVIGVGSTNSAADQILFSYGTNVTAQSTALRVVNNQPVLEGYASNVGGTANSFPGNRTPHIATGTYSGTAGSLFLDGRSQSTATLAWNTNNTRDGQIGRYTDNYRYWNGKIGEIIVYNKVLSATEMQQVNSYLGLKYGITFNGGLSDYLASDGTSYWTNDATYKNRITGIGKDITTRLYQKQSLSVDTGWVTIALGNTIAAGNMANTATITNDRSFFVFADNGGTTKYTTTVTGIDKVNIALARTWKVQKTNWVDQDITLATDTTVGVPQYLVISSDAAFGAGDVALPLTNGRITINTSQFPAVAYFTFANTLSGPGGITTNLSTWYKADKGITATTTVSKWADQSGLGKDVTQGTAAAQPLYNTAAGLINFNPSLGFDGSNDLLINDAFNHSAAASGEDVYAVVLPNNAPSVYGAITGFGTLASSANATQFRYGANVLQYLSRTNAVSWQVISHPVATAGKVQLPNGNRNAAGAASLLLNGAQVATGTINLFPSTDYFSIGAYRESGAMGNYFNGYIAEVVVYNRQLLNTERQRVASYLAVKYGITLAHNYVDAAGNIVWNATNNAAYSKRITGIGRDSVTALYQKQSLSVDTGIVTIALGNAVKVANGSNTSVIPNDRSYLLFGDDGAAVSYLTAVTGITGVNTRMNRIFKAGKTNWADQDITLKLNGANTKTYLLVSDDINFGAGDAAYPFTDSTITLNSSNLPDNYYFTFATTLKGPNRVDDGVVLWLRADDGTMSGATWNDFSGRGITATQTAAASQPAADAQGLNFNYALNFNGSSHFLTIPNASIVNTFPFGNAPRTVIGVATVNSTADQTFFSYGTNLTGQATGLRVNNGLPIFTGWSANVFGTANSFPANGPSHILAGNYNGASGTVFLDGNAQATAATAWNTNNTREVQIGRLPDGGYLWNGKVGEVIVYNRMLSNTELQLVNSYLSLKYGITMNAGTLDYRASNGTSYWTNNATYKNRITGIGRDDSTSLNTKQSLSVDTGFVTLALGSSVALTNELNSSTITNDRSFLVLADNGLSAANFAVQVTGSAHNVTRRMERVWKVQKTNWADQMITFRIKPIGVDNYLLISSDPTFATFTQELPVASDGTVTFSSALFTATDLYFTFGAPVKSPGGVGGHNLWVRSDLGTSSANDNTLIDQWNDFSAFLNHATQPTPANQPYYMNNTRDNMNFNPVVKFNGSQWMNLDVTKLPVGTSARTLIGIGNLNNTSGQRYLLGYGAAGTNLASGLSNVNTAGYFSGYANDVNSAANLWQVNVTNMLMGTWAGGSNGIASLYSKMASVATPVAKPWNTGTSAGARIGCSAWTTTETWSGPMGDIIVYPFVLNDGQRLQVETYMAIKYGYTISQATPNNYLATDGSVIWDATASSTYKYNIAGIGRDDEEALNQKQSRSINAGTQVIIGLGRIDSVNTANTNTFSTDRSYLVWSDDSASLSFRTLVSGYANANARMTRVWKVQETGAVGNVQVAIPATALANKAKSYLVVSNDVTFDGSDVFTQLTPVVINGVNHYAATVDLKNNDYFTFATDLKIPGGVTGNALWLRADYGTSSAVDRTPINEWDDFGADINHATQTTVANQPVFQNNTVANMNFNPVVDFDGSDDLMKANSVWGTTPIKNLAIFAVANSRAGANNVMFSEATTGGTIYTHAPHSNGNVYWYAPSSAGSTSGPWTGAFNTPNLWSFIRSNPGTTPAFTVSLNNKQILSTVVANTAYAGNNSPFGIGAHVVGADPFNGRISEMIVYNSDSLTPGSRLKIQSYLGIKYGITLNQATPANYLATDSTVIWDATANAAYKHNITGIGRDDLEGLNQKQSRSINAGTQVIIGLGRIDSVNTANTNTFSTDRSYLIWGDDSASLSFRTLVSGYANANARMTRVWKVQETGTVGNVQIAIPASALVNTAKSYLVVSTDAVFNGSDVFTQLTPVVINGVNHYTATVDLQNNQYFTFASDLKMPGGVVGNTLWLRPDYGTSSATDGTAINEWDDFGADINHATQTTAANQPLFMNNTKDNMNFNPVVKFNGTSHFMSLDITKLPMGTTARTLIGTGTLADINSSRAILTYGATVTGQGMSLANINGTGYWIGYNDDIGTAAGFWQPNTPGILFGTWAGSGGAANLYSKMRPVATTVNKNWNTTGTLAQVGGSPWGSGYWSGPMGDVIVYPFVLNDGQRLKVESYLAIKYGYTIDQTTANNYLATDSSVIWNATVNSTYKRNIAGIGRDDLEGLNQKQSRSIHAGTQVIIGLGSIDSVNTANAHTFSADRSYLIWGDDSATLSFRTPVNGYPGVNMRMTRVWKVQETGTVGTVQIAIPAGALTNHAAAHLIVSTDAVFNGSDVFTPLTPVVINGVNHYTATVDLQNNNYFTFATDLILPGGVRGANLWVRADKGTAATTDNTALNGWADYGADVNHASQPTAANQPLFMSNAKDNVNFNPVVKFNGTSHRMILDGTKLPLGTNPRTVFTITANAVTANRGVLGWGSPSTTTTGTSYNVKVGGGTRSIDVSGSLYGNTGGNTISPGITSFASGRNTTTSAALIRVNGTGVTNTVICCANPAFSTPSNAYAYLGDVIFGGSYYTGSLGEVVVYDSVLNAVDQQRVESYLAIKYGITLNSGNTDYLAADGITQVWNATANSTYKYGITGIGRDDIEGLMQKQSRNSDTTRLSIAIGVTKVAEDNLGNTGSFPSDLSYFIWGDDNGSASFKTPVTGNPAVNYRMGRVWKVQETGVVGTVEVAIPYDVLPNPKQSYLVVSTTDEVFDNADDVYLPLSQTTINGKRHWAAQLDLNTSQYFTIAAFIKSPGGVGVTSLWMRPDHGIVNNTDAQLVDTWVDFGNEANTATQTNTTVQPVFRNNATDNINYNPVMKFNGSNQFMNLDITRLPVGTTARTVIGVGKPGTLTGSQYMFSWGTNANTQGMGLSNNAGGTGYWVGYNNDVTTAAGFWQVNVPNELFGTWTGAGGIVNLYSKIAQVATPVNRSWNTGTSAGARIGSTAWNTEYWNGALSDLIVFDRALSDNERQRVSTYLAIRNGYTIDQATPYSNYLNTNSTVIWDAAANVNYKNNIAGIGRDDIEGLEQKQSKSVQAGAIVAIGLGAIAADNPSNSNTFISDTAYMVWGSSSQALTTQATDLPALFPLRLTQEWKVRLSNFNNAGNPVGMEFDLTGITHNGSQTGDFNLLIDTDGDGDFTTGTINQLSAAGYSNGKVTFSNVTALTDGVVFTLAIGQQGLRVTTKVILQGAWNGTAMRTNLKNAGLLPDTDPYGKGATPSVSPNAATAEVVDWVLVELRDPANPASVVASKAALVLSNGNVVDTNYTQPVVFYGVNAANYKVAVRHRNHLGMMTLNDVNLSTGAATIDFTTTATATYGNHARKDLGSGIMGMWAGNVNGDVSIRHSAKPSDVTAVTNAVVTHPGNTTASLTYTAFNNTYSVYDVNLDGRVYAGALPSDRDMIINNVMTHPANVFKMASYIITEQLP